jgi:hypothetical protein
MIELKLYQNSEKLICNVNIGKIHAKLETTGKCRLNKNTRIETRVATAS